jgi:mannose-6-phosphate isomerase
VVAGTGRVTVDGAVSDLTPGASVDVPVGVAHRVENCGEAELVFIEVQHGTYFGEDDTVRLEDDYGRVR